MSAGTACQVYGLAKISQAIKKEEECQLQQQID